MDLLVGFGTKKIDAAYFRRFINEAETELYGAQPLFVFDNHDNVRSIDRFANGAQDVAIAKCIAAILLTTRSTAMTYYGAELGMRTTPPTRKEDVKDPVGIVGWPNEKGRDGERTPMQWTPGPQAGFSTNPHTWLPIPPNYTTINVETETADPNSLLNWYKQLIALRRSLPALHDGGMEMLNKDSKDVLSYVRTGPAPVLVAINLSADAQTVSFDVPSAHAVKTLAATDPSLQAVTTLHAVKLPPFSAWVASIQ
jgi:alpha-glucosidase